MIVDRHNQGLNQASKKCKELKVGKRESSRNIPEKQAKILLHLIVHHGAL